MFENEYRRSVPSSTSYLDVPTIDIDSLLSKTVDEAERFHRWRLLLELATSRGIRTPSMVELLTGELVVTEGPRVLWMTRAAPEFVADLASIAAEVPHRLVWSVSARDVDATMVHAAGLGVVCAASLGVPATKLPLGELRRELSEARDAVGGAVGYAPRILDPLDADRLVATEAARAGFTGLLAPTRCEVDTPISQVCDWVEGRGVVGIARRLKRWGRQRLPID